MFYRRIAVFAFVLALIAVLLAVTKEAVVTHNRSACITGISLLVADFYSITVEAVITYFWSAAAHAVGADVAVALYAAAAAG